MGKSFRRRHDEWDEITEFRREKFRKRRSDKLKKKTSHDQALRPVVQEENNKEEDELAQVYLRV